MNLREVELNVFIHVKAAMIIGTITDPVLLNEWWGVQKSLIEPKTGGCFTLAWNVTDNGFGFVF